MRRIGLILLVLAWVGCDSPVRSTKDAGPDVPDHVDAIDLVDVPEDADVVDVVPTWPN